MVRLSRILALLFARILTAYQPSFKARPALRPLPRRGAAPLRAVASASSALPIPQQEEAGDGAERVRSARSWRRIRAASSHVFGARVRLTPWGAPPRPAKSIFAGPPSPQESTPPRRRPQKPPSPRRITEQCARGWLREQRKRGSLVLDAIQRLEVVEPESCDVEEGLARRCPDAVRLAASGVSWIGFKRRQDGLAKLRATRLDTELVNLHRRVLTKGRRGALRAELTLSGPDLDGSAWIRTQLDRVVRRALVSYFRRADNLMRRVVAPPLPRRG